MLGGWEPRRSLDSGPGVVRVLLSDEICRLSEKVVIYWVREREVRGRERKRGRRR